MKFGPNWPRYHMVLNVVPLYFAFSGSLTPEISSFLGPRGEVRWKDVAIDPVTPTPVHHAYDRRFIRVSRHLSLKVLVDVQWPLARHTVESKHVDIGAAIVHITHVWLLFSIPLSFSLTQTAFVCLQCFYDLETPCHLKN